MNGPHGRRAVDLDEVADLVREAADAADTATCAAYVAAAFAGVTFVVLVVPGARRALGEMNRAQRYIVAGTLLLAGVVAGTFAAMENRMPEYRIEAAVLPLATIGLIGAGLYVFAERGDKQTGGKA